MDLTQRKLSRMEWESIEVPVSESEQEVLRLLQRGFVEPTYRYNRHVSLASHLKMVTSDGVSKTMEDYLYNRFFRSTIEQLDEVMVKQGVVETSYVTPLQVDTLVKLRSVDRVRLEHQSAWSLDSDQACLVFEGVLLREASACLRQWSRVEERHVRYVTLYHLLQTSVLHVNRHVVQWLRGWMAASEGQIDVTYIVTHAHECLEVNATMHAYADLSLYQHQRDLFATVKRPGPKLVCYMAPTGTGKTLSPIALTEPQGPEGRSYRVLFVCGARHVGLALARAAVSMHKRVAFAFGCESASDIRLHYFAAKECTRNKRTGKITKVDNSQGEKVEILISDVQSFLPAMYYLQAFFPLDELLLYWDEPTIALDYAEHPFHPMIQKNWQENLIPNVVLSSATLPPLHELQGVIAGFEWKFPRLPKQPQLVYVIASRDSPKSIPLLNNEGCVVLPHTLAKTQTEWSRAVACCQSNVSLLRYLDLEGIGVFLQKHAVQCAEWVPRYFDGLSSITVQAVKQFYLALMESLTECWSTLDNSSLPPRFVDAATGEGTLGIYVTTKDAYTVTDGPAMFLADDVEKIAGFCIQQAAIPSQLMAEIYAKLEHNHQLAERIAIVEAEVDRLKEMMDSQCRNQVSDDSVSTRGKSGKELKRTTRGHPDEELNGGSVYGRLQQEWRQLRAQIQTTSLPDVYIPNRRPHLERWCKSARTGSVFSSRVEESTVSDILSLDNVPLSYKVLLLMGIGVFSLSVNVSYMEIMKRLADEQRLYLIIANSDYIYGTNYQFCHGFLGKDLPLTRDKLIQAIGRIGRTHLRQSYTVRVRSDEHLRLLFLPDPESVSIESRNMNRLFSMTSV